MNSKIKTRFFNAILISSLVCITLTSVSCNAVKPKENKENEADYPISVVPFTSVTLTDNFWSKRIETNRTVTIPFGFDKCEEEGRVRNFAKAGGLLEGKYEGQMPFDDTDV